jgi:hypothetical protein
MLPLFQVKTKERIVLFGSSCADYPSWEKYFSMELSGCFCIYFPCGFEALRIQVLQNAGFHVHPAIVAVTGFSFRIVCVANTVNFWQHHI